jgi:hypothetical protein
MSALPEDVVAAIQLALEGAANPGIAVEVIERLCNQAGTYDGTRPQATQLLVDTLREMNATFDFNQGTD